MLTVMIEPLNAGAPHGFVTANLPNFYKLFGVVIVAGTIRIIIQILFNRLMRAKKGYKAK